MPSNARLLALGGENVSLADRDPSFVFSNPALIGDTLSRVAAAGVQFYMADVVGSSVVYAHSFSGIGPVAFGVFHLGFGHVPAYDATGAELGMYQAGETVLAVGKSHQLGQFRLGLNLKAAISSIAGYHATALMTDLGGVFMHPYREFDVALVIRNLGFMLQEYSGTSRTSLPIDVQIGTTFKPEHMPVRFSVTAYDLVQTRDYGAGTFVEERKQLDKLFGHFTFGAEVILNRNFSVLTAYNFLRHQQLALERGGVPGFSIGLGAKVRAFEFVAARSAFFAGQAAYAFSILTNWNEILR